MNRSSRRRQLGAAVIAGALVGAIPLAGRAAAGPSALGVAQTPTPANLIRDPGAEGARPDAAGNKVPVTGWTTGGNDNFTSVAYGTSGFLAGTSPGPAHRGHNFFAGGQSGNSSTGTQVDSLSADRRLIRSGHARFTLSGWLGGYSDQGDHASLRVTWETSAGAPISRAHIGPVSVAQRDDTTELLFRTTVGAVPPTASSVLVTLSMVRDAGEYVDGYADNLSLSVYKA